MNDLSNIAMLIDADNTPYSKVQDVMQEISAHGRIVVKRAYGNWKKETLKKWEDELKRLAINAVQQFDYVSGKNATDMALVIDAMTLLYKNRYDAFVIVASDSDYTPLAITLHESGVYVIGVGNKNTPEAFRNSCDEFIILENIGADSEDVSVTEDTAGTKSVEKSGAKSGKIGEIHNLIKLAAEKYQDDEGFTNIGSAGQYIKRAKPDFDVRSYGYKQLLKFLQAFPDKYEVKHKNGSTNYVYRYIEKQTAKKASAKKKKNG